MHLLIFDLVGLMAQVFSSQEVAVVLSVQENTNGILSVLLVLTLFTRCIGQQQFKCSGE